MRIQAGSRSRSSAKGSSWNRTALIAFAAAAMLTFCLYFTSNEQPQQASSATRRTAMVTDSGKGHAVTLVAGAPTAPQVHSVSTPSPRVEVGKHDERHPDNVAQIIKDASHHDEHKHDTLQSFIRQKSDTSAQASSKSPPPPKPSLSPPPSPSPSPSTVSGRAAALKHATDHLKEAAEKLGNRTLPKNGTLPKSNASSTTLSLDTRKIGKGTPAQGKKSKANTTQVASKGTTLSIGKNKTKAPAIDLLAYSKEQGQPGDTMHVLFTSNGSPYQNFQARIMVAGFRLAQKMPGGEKMVAMTRILHRTTPDEVMDEIPTFRADPLQPECDKWCWFPVADRANAVQQWIDTAHADPSIVKAPWILLLETDYVWIKPLEAMGSAYEPLVPGLAFRFDYIAPQHYLVQQILKERCPDCKPGSVPGSGPAPVLARFSDFRAATPLWEEISLWIETHKEAKDSLGWVREMYAWDIGVAAHKLNILTLGHPSTTLISQPPHDTHAYNATMYHYTWGVIVKDSAGKEWWKWDKRFYTDANDALKVPLLKLPPPLIDGLKMQDGMPFTQDLHNVLTDMLTLMNKAIETLPDLRKTGTA